METKPLISVIVPIYKVEKYLVRCINSIINQTYSNLEIILVDDGSPDSCGKICDDFSTADARIYTIHKTNGGLSSARNAGLDSAHGEYIGFVDSDDYIEPNMYETMYKAIIETDAEIAACGIIRENEETHAAKLIRCPHTQKIYTDEEALKEIFLSRNLGIGVWSKLYSRQVFQNIRFPIGETNEDAAILMQSILGRKLVHTACPSYHYMVRQGSITYRYDSGNTSDLWNHNLQICKSVDEQCPALKKVALYYCVQSMFGALCAYEKQDEVRDNNYRLYSDFVNRNIRFMIACAPIGQKIQVLAILIRRYIKMELR